MTFAMLKTSGSKTPPPIFIATIRLHIIDDVLRKLTTFPQLSAFQLTFEIVGHGLVLDRAFHTFNNQVGGFEPVHVAQQ